MLPLVETKEEENGQAKGQDRHDVEEDEGRLKIHGGLLYLLTSRTLVVEAGPTLPPWPIDALLTNFTYCSLSALTMLTT